MTSTILPLQKDYLDKLEKLDELEKDILPV